MKTAYEVKFEQFIIASICLRDCSVGEKTKLITEFYKHGNLYYEQLCDFLFYLSTGERKGYLFLTPAGKTYLSNFPSDSQDVLLFYGEELPHFDSDLYDQLNFFFNRVSLS